MSRKCIINKTFFYKDAGFVYESLRNESSNLEFMILRNKSTKRIFWKLCHETNLLKTRGFANPNPKDSDGFVCPIVLRIRKDSWDSSNLWKIVSQNESTKRIFWKLGHETNLLKIASRNGSTNRIFWKLTNRNESTFLRISYTIPASLLFYLQIRRKFTWINWDLCQVA